MFWRLFMFAAIVSFMSCSSNSSVNPKSPTDRVAHAEKGIERVRV